MIINVDGTAEENNTALPCTYHDHLGSEQRGRGCHYYPCPFCDEEVGVEPIPGTEGRFRWIPLDDAELGKSLRVSTFLTTSSPAGRALASAKAIAGC